jgi:hypothetical protein
VILRTCVVAGTYASFVSLLSLGGSWGLPLVATPFASVEAPAPSAYVGRGFSRAPFAGPKPGPTYWATGALAATAATEAAAASQAADQAAVPVRAARVERRDATGGPGAAAAAIAAADRRPVWLAWTVPAVHNDRDEPSVRDRRDDAERGCVLDEDGHLEHGSSTTRDTTELVVLARLQDGAIGRVTFTDARCTVDAGNRTVYFLEHVRPADSVVWLARLVDSGDPGSARLQPGRDPDHRPHRLESPTLAVIALTDDPSADRVLEGFVAPDQPSDLRRDAAFWLGAARGTGGAAVVDRLARTDRDEAFRTHLMFVLTLTGDRGLERLIDRARNDESPGVRGQALFWIAQKAGERAVGTLARAVADDPDVEVRKRAVFAISQLPKDEAVPRLIALAESHRDREVRQQAMFWLGQSGDPRALTFFEQVLRK